MSFRERLGTDKWKEGMISKLPSHTLVPLCCTITMCRQPSFIDGACYMEAVAKAIAQAEHEVFITDWCMNPEVFLRRPVRTNTWRLDKLLQAKAYIIAAAFLLCSFKMTVKLVYLSPTLIKFWSHHEKMVVVDQSIVFMGGIDLCYGRWDTVNHRALVSYLTISYSYAFSTILPTVLHNCFIQCSLEDVPKTSHVLWRETSLLDVTMRAEQRQKPVTHELANKPRDDTGPISHLKSHQRSRSASESRSTVWHFPKPFRRNLPVLKDRRTERVIGSNVNSNISKPKRNQHRHFTGMHPLDTALVFFLRNLLMQSKDLEDHSKKQVISYRHCFLGRLPRKRITCPDVSYYEDSDLMYLEAQWGSHLQQLEGHVNVSYENDVDTDNVYPNPNEVLDLESLCELGNLCTWVGQDYVNWNKGDPNPKLKAAQDLYDRNEVPRMPWHDIACVMSGRIACDFARHFIQRWNAIRNSRIRNAGKGTSERERRRRKPLLIPATPCSPWTENELTTVLLDPRQTAVCRAQALRSVCDWSLGIPAENVGRSARTEFRRWIKGDDRTSTVSINTPKTSKIGLECSIHTAYVDSILNAERFVLIENQFFISFVTMTDEDAISAYDRSTGADTPNWDTQTSVQQEHNIHTRLQASSHVATVKNRIADALFVRILRAHRLVV
ncbi:hypothetical protein AHF37_04536 [Paragonimus kellicotti]|nr:hypothetical protein AHF37_04536 [Paragonimus kellicotti]